MKRLLHHSRRVGSGLTFSRKIEWLSSRSFPRYFSSESKAQVNEETTDEKQQQQQQGEEKQTSENDKKEEETEYTMDPKFDNIIHGVFSRDDYERFTGRSFAEVGRLGRLFIYQNHCCPFSGKVKSFLDYYKIPYSLIECNPITKTQLPDPKFFLHDRNVPILLATPAKTKGSMARYKLLYQSNVIVVKRESILAQYLRICMYVCVERANSEIVQTWHDWLDSELIPHWYIAIGSSEKDVTQYFDYLDEFSKFQSVGLNSFFLISSLHTFPFFFINKYFRFELKKNCLIVTTQKGKEIDALVQVMNEWHQVTKETFHGGTKPDLADLMAFGILRTFSQLPLFHTVKNELGLSDWEWFNAMKELLGKTSCVTHA
ncbi:glutathione-S-transferase/glutaredoxin [Reticulomyxa filosa]|uniref:Glutathione-S-transferase/glutaredoxin n=1 Tax=Reticulomyxa filosa TaxID=46433 RepID=X6NWY9_RETFI|nr:glutathione-S-transferase/glutaredoxin [Reticulomyxa filosa]|eukprot:ETO30506.1 glutathione-S-transferase/glutaredoxin [Reticulomyxa filosa]